MLNIENKQLQNPMSKNPLKPPQISKNIIYGNTMSNKSGKTTSQKPLFKSFSKESAMKELALIDHLMCNIIQKLG